MVQIVSAMRHRSDLYIKSTVVNSAGQKSPTWTLSSSDIKCHYVPRSSDTRTSPTQEEWDDIWMMFPADCGITYQHRIYNIHDKFGNVIEAGPLEVNGLLRQPGFSGRVHHIAVKVRRVVES